MQCLRSDNNTFSILKHVCLSCVGGLSFNPDRKGEIQKSLDRQQKKKRFPQEKVFFHPREKDF